jgi:AbrB family looped-hinge helix DNA binding protein
MSTVTVSDKGQVVIPAEIRRRLGLVPGSKLDFTLEGDGIRVRPLKSIPPSRAEDGYGLLRCKRSGERRLTDFDVAVAMRVQADDGHHRQALTAGKT